METIPDLRITFDVSHWCNVHESLLADQQETLELTLQRTDHIHARIGHAEGPQVNDPRAPEWEEALNAHLAWWDKVVEIKKQKGEVLTILTEFGPPDYMPTLPYTRQPLADQWAINVYMMQLLRQRYHLNNFYVLLSITEFFAHFHPLLVHLPIGILLIGIALLWLSEKNKYASFKPAVPFILLCGAITALISCITGFFCRSVTTMTTTSWAGINGWALQSLLLPGYCLPKKKIPGFPSTRKYFRLACLLLIMITGHLGGSLTHGSDYLTKPLFSAFDDDSTSGAVIKPIPNVQEAAVYDDVIKPILQTKCYSCHGPNKQKGKLAHG